MQLVTNVCSDNLAINLGQAPSPQPLKPFYPLPVTAMRSELVPVIPTPIKKRSPQKHEIPSFGQESPLWCFFCAKPVPERFSLVAHLSTFHLDEMVDSLCSSQMKVSHIDLQRQQHDSLHQGTTGCFLPQQIHNISSNAFVLSIPLSHHQHSDVSF